jgi:ubiquinone/menaquinone biosynthesis C-methylase UbiE
MPAEQRYVPAAGLSILTRVYDPLIALMMRERSFRGAVLEALLAEPPPATVADIGCGTGTLALAIAERAPQTRVIGVDGDPEVLGIARAKSGADGIEWHEALVDSLPLAEASADAVTMTLLLHHLAPSGKTAALREARRILRPGGRLVIADWGRPRDPLTSTGFLVLQLIDGFAGTSEHRAGGLPGRIEQAGFTAPRLLRTWRTVWGSLELLVAEAA